MFLEADFAMIQFDSTGKVRKKVNPSQAQILVEGMRETCEGIGSINTHCFHILGDGHQPSSRGLYTYYKDSYWDDHPQYRELIDPGTCVAIDC